MGKGGRIACIATPWAMTIVAMVLQIIVQLGGKTVDSALLNSVYGWQADFSNFKVDAGLNDVEQKVGSLFTQARSNKVLQEIYHINIYVSLHTLLGDPVTHILTESLTRTFARRAPQTEQSTSAATDTMALSSTLSQTLVSTTRLPPRSNAPMLSATESAMLRMPRKPRQSNISATALSRLCRRTRLPASG